MLGYVEVENPNLLELMMPEIPYELYMEIRVEYGRKFDGLEEIPIRGFNPCARFILHTVGPVIEIGVAPPEETRIPNEKVGSLHS